METGPEHPIIQTQDCLHSIASYVLSTYADSMCLIQEPRKGCLGECMWHMDASDTWPYAELTNIGGNRTFHKQAQPSFAGLHKTRHIKHVRQMQQCLSIFNLQTEAIVSQTKHESMRLREPGMIHTARILERTVCFCSYSPARHLTRCDNPQQTPPETRKTYPYFLSSRMVKTMM